MKSYKYSTKERAQRVSRTIGCTGYHTHEDGEKKIYMPCKSHKIFKSKVDSKKSGSEEEVTELIDADGTWLSSSMPILDPASTIQGSTTTDKIVPATRIARDIFLRGRYFGEGHVKEIDMSKAFGYEKTKDLDAEDTLKYFEEKLDDEDEAKERTMQFGKDPSGKRTKKAPLHIRKKKGFIDREIIKEKESDEVEEDIIIDKEKEIKTNNMLKKNIRSLKNMASKNGIGIEKLIRLIKDEQ
jgi:hypothetical protein